MDKRKAALIKGLEQLDSDELAKIIAQQDSVCFDSYNFDERTGFW